MSVESQLSRAHAYKESGSAHFRQKNYKLAIADYSKIFLWTNHLDVPSELKILKSQIEEPEAVDEKFDENENDFPTPVQVGIARSLRLAANSNLATCYFRLEDYEKCRKFAESALSLDSNHSKSKLRIAQTIMRQTPSQFESAESLLNQVKAEYPTDPELLNELKLVQIEKNKFKEKQRKIFSNMFNE